MFHHLQQQVVATSPAFGDKQYVKELEAQMEQLRGRELPGFMSTQAFYMFMANYVDAWKGPAEVKATPTQTNSPPSLPFLTSTFERV